MAYAFAETASTTEWTPKSILGLIVFALIIVFIIWHKKNKKAKQEKKSDIESSTKYNNMSLISIAKFQKVVHSRFVVFDLETTGLSPSNDKIVEIGAVRVENGKITERYQRFINPEIPMPPAATKVNHITDEMLNGYPPIKLVLPHFLKFVGNDILAAHNARFDAHFLRAACTEYKLDLPKEFFDTMSLSVYWPDLKDKKLESFLAAAGIKNKEAHRALEDAEATAELIIKSFDKIK